MKRTNKDTIKTINAAKTLIEYCARYKDCKNCVFNVAIENGLLLPHCAINKPFTYTEINEGGADNAGI